MNWDRLFSFRQLHDEPKPFLEHVEDLRRTIIKMMAVLVVMMIGAFYFQKQVIKPTN